MIDADLQDPPELIPTFVQHWREGYDVIYGTRASRAGETGFKRMTATGFYRVMGRFSSTPIPRDTGDFRLISRRALDALNQLRERQRFMKGLFTWVGYRQLSVVYHRDPRHAGRPSGTTGGCGTSRSRASLRSRRAAEAATYLVSCGRVRFPVRTLGVGQGALVRRPGAWLSLPDGDGALSGRSTTCGARRDRRIPWSTLCRTKQRPLYLIDEYDPSEGKAQSRAELSPPFRRETRASVWRGWPRPAVVVLGCGNLEYREADQPMFLVARPGTGTRPASRRGRLLGVRLAYGGDPQHSASNRNG